MTKFYSTILMLVWMLNLYGTAPHSFWETDYQGVVAKAQKENKPILLFFAGSDWSAMSMKMKREILDTAEFQAAVSMQLICMEIDFPKHKILPGPEEEQNRMLKERFAIEEYPSILLLDPHERPIAILGYVPKKGNNLAADLFRILKQDQNLHENLKNATTQPPVVQLKEWYASAQELGQQDAMLKLIDLGLKSDDKPFFLLEKYRFFVGKGRMFDPEALVIRKELIECDTTAEKTLHYSLALIDFQELAKKESDPEKVIQPLKEYLEEVTMPNPNHWRVEMMIAEFYLDSDAWKPALEHAETAFKHAPDDRKPEILRSLEYMKKQAI